MHPYKAAKGKCAHDDGTQWKQKGKGEAHDGSMGDLSTFSVRIDISFSARLRRSCTCLATGQHQALQS
jgi:hypothetical protein